MPERMRVAVVQVNAQDDKERNVRVALDLAAAAADDQARLVVLPEYVTYLGRTGGYAEAAEPIPGPTAERFAELARRRAIWLHAGSMLEQSDQPGKYYNTSLFFDPRGQLVATYRKIHLFDVELADEGPGYRESNTILPGEQVVSVQLDRLRVGLTTCYDLRFPELYRQLALDGAELIVVPAAFTLQTGRDHWEVLLRARAIENGAFILAAAQVGQHPPGQWCFGRSMIIDPWGTVLAQAVDEECFVAATLDLTRPRKVRQAIPSLANRRPAVYERASLAPSRG